MNRVLKGVFWVVFVVLLLFGCKGPDKEVSIGDILTMPVYRKDFPEEGIRCYYVRAYQLFGLSCLPLEDE